MIEGNEVREVGQLIKVANTLIERELNNRVAAILPESDLTGPQIILLVYLYDSKGRTVTQKEMADRFVLSHPTMRGIVRRLEKSKLIDISHLQSDRRQVVLSLSEHGFEVVDRHINDIRKVMADVDSRIGSSLNANEQHELRELLGRVIHGF